MPRRRSFRGSKKSRATSSKRRSFRHNSKLRKKRSFWRNSKLRKKRASYRGTDGPVKEWNFFLYDDYDDDVEYQAALQAEASTFAKFIVSTKKKEKAGNDSYDDPLSVWMTSAELNDDSEKKYVFVDDIEQANDKFGDLLGKLFFEQKDTSRFMKSKSLFYFNGDYEITLGVVKITFFNDNHELYKNEFIMYNRAGRRTTRGMPRQSWSTVLHATSTHPGILVEMQNFDQDKERYTLSFGVLAKRLWTGKNGGPLPQDSGNIYVKFDLYNPTESIWMGQDSLVPDGRM